MLNYTYSAILDTLDFIKKVLNIADVIIQLCYIMYVVYRIFNQLGIQYINIILLVLTFGYFIYHLLMIREFYTEKQLIQKKAVRNSVKIAKYIIILFVIISGVIQLYQSSVADNMAMLMIMLMVIGYIFSIIFDVIRIIINNQIALIRSSFLYDIEQLKERVDDFKKNPRIKFSDIILTLFSTIAKRLKIDIDKVPVVKNKKMREKIVKVNDKREKKKKRKENFIALKR